MTEPVPPDIRRPRTDAQRGDGRSRTRYLPSAQVLAELAPLGPDLGRLAEDLRERLTGPSDVRDDVASNSS
ncbi:MAG: hypothetical protein WBH47_15365 [Streptosporangiaceae bacterium]